jgi:carbon storage regulator
MLVINRKRGESIRIGDDIVITVLEFRDGRVKLGIDAPLEISVNRQEVLDRRKDEK